MNADELVNELKAIRHQFEWRLVPHTVIEGDRRSQVRLKVRGKCKNGPEDLWFEPIGAVCYIRTGVAYDEDHWLESAFTLELSPQDAKDLVAAANDLAWRHVNDRREPNPYRQTLRATIAAAVGLQIPAERRI